MDDKMQWFVVNVHTGCEDKVARGMREQIDKRRLNAYFGEIMVPTREITEIKGGKRVKVDKKFFPGYIVVQMIMNNEINDSKTISAILTYYLKYCKKN